MIMECSLTTDLGLQDSGFTNIATVLLKDVLLLHPGFARSSASLA